MIPFPLKEKKPGAKNFFLEEVVPMATSITTMQFTEPGGTLGDP